MKKISIKSKLYLNILPIIIVGIFLTFAMLYYIANDRYIDYLNEQYDDDITYLINVSKDIISSGELPRDEHINLPNSSIGIMVYDSNNNPIYTFESSTNKMQDITCCDKTTYEIDGYGKLEVYNHCNVDETDNSLSFRQDLIKTIVISGLITLLISIFVINRFAKKMSSELSTISDYASEIETGNLDSNVNTDVIEIDSINHSLFNLGVRLSEKERLRKEKIDLIKHQLSTPLTIIKTTLEGMIDDVIDLDKEYLNRCLVENDRVRDKLDNLYLDIEKHNEIIRSEEINLKDLVKDIMHNFRVSFEQKGVNLTTQLNDLVLETDKNLMVSSIYNILSNAYKYTKKGDTVSIVLNDKLIISDTGIGISDADKDRIFEAYYRGINSEQLNGKGLGLYDTKNNLERLGYTITLDKMEKNTTFIIDFKI